MSRNVQRIVTAVIVVLLIIAIVGILLLNVLIKKQKRDIMLYKEILERVFNENIRCDIKKEYTVLPLDSYDGWNIATSRQIFTDDAKMSNDDISHINSRIDDYCLARVIVSVKNDSPEEVILMNVYLNESSNQVWISNRFCVESQQSVAANSSIEYEFGIIYDSKETSVESILSNMNLNVNCCLTNFPTQECFQFKISNGK